MDMKIPLYVCRNIAEKLSLEDQLHTHYPPSSACSYSGLLTNEWTN